MNEMVESTQAEPETLSYDWFVSDDRSTVHIYERYADLGRARHATSPGSSGSSRSAS